MAIVQRGMHKGLVHQSDQGRPNTCRKTSLHNLGKAIEASIQYAQGTLS